MIPLDRWLDHWADHDPDAIAIEFGDERLTYPALVDAVARMAGALAAAGVEPGSRVAYLGGDGPLPLTVFFACARIGAVHVPLNTRLVPSELSWIIRHSDPVLALADAEHASVLVRSVADAPSTRCAVVGGPATAGLDALEPCDDVPTRATTGDEAVLMCYTSGTTGRPKGAVLTHTSIAANAVNVHAMMDLTPADRVLNTMPLFHVGGLNVHCTPTLAAGATLVLHPRFDPRCVLDALVSGSIDLVTLLAPMLVAVTGLSEWADADLSGVRAVNTGASMIPSALIEAVHAKGVPVTQIYGLTETSTLATYLRKEHAHERLGSCGKGALTCEVRLVDDDGRDVAPGTAGEIVARGPNLFREYWRDPEATADAFFDGGWFRTGDVAVADDAGFIYVQDRKKDMIISGGENVYPAELEQLLVGVPGVVESTIIGRADDRWGEVPIVVAVRDDETVVDDDLLAVFDGRVARYKAPKAVAWVDSLPRTAMGKVQKHLLRADLAG